MTLTIKLIQDIIKVNPCTKFGDHMSNGSAVRVFTHTHRHTHTPTDGTVFITSTADAGGNKDGSQNWGGFAHIESLVFYCFKGTFYQVLGPLLRKNVASEIYDVYKREVHLRM